MNIETNTINNSTKKTQTKIENQNSKDTSVNFSNELKDLEIEKKTIEEKNTVEDATEVNNALETDTNLNYPKDLVTNITLETKSNNELNKIIIQNTNSQTTENELPLNIDSEIKNNEELILNVNSNLKSEKNVIKIDNPESKKIIENKIPLSIKNKNEEKQIKPEKTINPQNESIEFAIQDLNNMVKQINQLDDNNEEKVKKENIITDNKDMINNDFNIDNKDILPQMTPNMNFNSNGQPFSSFIEEDAQKKSKKTLAASSAELAEEAAILSTMAENIAIANKNNIIKQNEKTIINNEGIKKVDTKTAITTEIIVKYDSIIMNEADVEVFTQLVQQGSVDIKNLAPQAAEKSIQVSKTLADMLAKSMESGQPLRIDFDNDISVIIRISRDGKITADFLPSSQVAEAYLKENLPLLRQKFDNENIKYDELNQRERKEQAKDQNRKKGRNNE